MSHSALALRSALSFVFVGALFVAFTAEQTACSSKTCSSSEESACTNTYTDCVNKAAASSTAKADCQKCVDNYCSCYDSCGNSCDRNNLNSACAGLP